ncbi:MAG TPA: hypothetical protein VHT48_00530 [Methylocella sp.]|nr:hypothetical protein [Methylocella sp.]
MNMEFSQTSGSKPELDRGTGIILKYDGDTANGQAVSLGREFFSDGAGQKRVSAHMGSTRARNRMILHDLRHNLYGETGFHCRRPSAKKLNRVLSTRMLLLDKESLKISILA